ncbi:uncharacterized protein VTP21DRAFT_1156 [Calcarisporiella thermophila]|uniref:uncharacterized protein n=1 Tax=Calcarisporiella thermophila TaxID=911321 RepID=UPI00374259DE
MNFSFVIAILFGILFALTSASPTELSKRQEEDSLVSEEFDEDQFRGAFLVIWSRCNFRGEQTIIRRLGCSSDISSLNVRSWKVRRGYRATWYEYDACPRDGIISVSRKCNRESNVASVRIRKRDDKD